MLRWFCLWGDELPQSRLRRASPLWDGAFLRYGKLAPQVKAPSQRELSSDSETEGVFSLSLRALFLPGSIALGRRFRLRLGRCGGFGG